MMDEWEYGRVLITSDPRLAAIHPGYLARYAAGWRRYRPLLGRFAVDLDAGQRADRRAIVAHVARLRGEGWQPVERVVMPQGVAELRFRRAQAATTDA